MEDCISREYIKSEAKRIAAIPHPDPIINMVRRQAFEEFTTAIDTAPHMEVVVGSNQLKCEQEMITYEQKL